MKRTLLLVTMLLSIISARAQWCSDNGLSYSFEDTTCMYRFSFPSPGSNVWQAGTPQKTMFTGGYYSSRAIVTDTLNPYPPNNTSSFIISMLDLGGFSAPHTAIVQGAYSVHSDSLTDFGTIEVSADSGQTWIDIVNDPAYYQYIYGQRPVLTGNSTGWQEFYLDISQLGNGPFANVQSGDLILYKFTFVSDSNQSNKDGLMFDSLTFINYVESINEYGNIGSKVFPNPASELTMLEFDNAAHEDMSVMIIDNTGRTVMQETTSQTKLALSTSDLAAGAYHYYISNKNGTKHSRGKIVVRGNSR